MINKKISTLAGSLIILAIVVAIGIAFFSGKEREMQNQNNIVLNEVELENEEAITENRQEEKIDTSNWKVCKNEKANYEFKYPSGWLIVNRYLTVFEDCSDASDLRGNGFSIGPDRYSASNKSFGINTSTQKDLEVTIYKGVTSLDEYYSRNDKLLSSRTKLKETTLLGERVDWTQSKDRISINFFHNNTLYEIDSNIENQRLLETILDTFKFPNN